MRGRNPSADSAAGMAGAVRDRAAPEPHHSGHKGVNPGGLGAEPPTPAIVAKPPH